jgi:hypothetical protein
VESLLSEVVRKPLLFRHTMPDNALSLFEELILSCLYTVLFFLLVSFYPIFLDDS